MTETADGPDAQGGAPLVGRLRRSELRRFRRHLSNEHEHIARYRALAERATGEHREVLLELAAAEERHAAYWGRKLAERGADVPDAGRHRPNLTTRFLSWLSRRVGVSLVVPLLERLEAAEISRYDAEPQATLGMAAQERLHAELVASLAPTWRTRASGSLRAAVFGLNDGLVSNLALVMGMVGGGATGDTVLLAGLAGLVAGAGSMAAGEYVSVKSQRELFEGVTRLGADAVSSLSADEPAQLELLLRVRGVDPATMASVTSGGSLAHQAVADRLAAAGVDIDTAQLGSPTGAATSSFVAFALGAALPVLPFLFAAGTVALTVAVALAALALFLVGGTISLVTNRPLLRAGVRQLLVGGVAAAGTYLVGRTIGVIVG